MNTIETDAQIKTLIDLCYLAASNNKLLAVQIADKEEFCIMDADVISPSDYITYSGPLKYYRPASFLEGIIHS
jgi:hypothetical protein